MVMSALGFDPCLRASLPACNEFFRITSGVTPVDLLAASMAAEPLLPSATKLWRLCFYSCVSVHRGGVVSQHALQVVSQHALQQVSRGGAWSGRVCSRGGWYPSMHWGRPPPPGRDSYCCGRYASHWNAFFVDPCTCTLHSMMTFLRNLRFFHEKQPSIHVLFHFSLSCIAKWSFQRNIPWHRRLYESLDRASNF